jgi:hydroxyacylglutathione hydrolase
MIFERIKSEGLAHNSYFISSGHQAVVIDPRRDIQVYLDRAMKYGVRIKYILETHRNEDYVIGSSELSYAVQAPVYHGPWLDWKYGNVIKDGQEFNLGKIKLTAMHTPGHTDESTSYVLRDTETGNAPVMVFTGDNLFVNETGRVDLYGLAEVPRLAGNLYDSLFNRILPLGDGVIICPAHGSGSICGQAIASRDESTLGIEKLQNPALQYTDKDSFMRYKAAERLDRPPYFIQMEKYNLEGAPLLHGLPRPPLLAPMDFKREMEKGAVVVDTRLPPAFGGAHIKGSYSIWLEGLSSFAGWLLSYDKPVLLVLEEKEHLDAAVRHLIRVGFDRIDGYLTDGVEDWYNAGLPVEQLPLLSVQQLKKKVDQGEDLTLLDVRRQDEWDTGHVPGAMHVFVGQVERRLSEIPRDKPVVVMCNVGHRAGIAASILLREGYPEVFNLLGSVTAWRHAGYPLTKEG